MRDNDENRFEALLPLSADADDEQVTAQSSATRKKKLHPEVLAHAPSLVAPLIPSAPPRRNKPTAPLGTSIPAERAFPAYELLVRSGGALITQEMAVAHHQAVLNRDQDVRTPYPTPSGSPRFVGRRSTSSLSLSASGGEQRSAEYGRKTTTDVQHASFRTEQDD